MIQLIDQKKLRDTLKNMDDNQREQYVNGLMDLLGFKDLKKGNNSIDVAFGNVATAIVLIEPQLLSQKMDEIKRYLKGLGDIYK